MSQVIEAPVEVRLPEERRRLRPDSPWIVIVWNDPINLMSYVTFVLRKLFGYSKDGGDPADAAGAQRGKGGRLVREKEKAEFDVARLHAHGLWATLRQD